MIKKEQLERDLKQVLLNKLVAEMQIAAIRNALAKQEAVNE